MDTLTFLSKITESLAWPLVVFVVFLVLQKEIVRSIPRLQRLKFKDAELEFQQKAQEIGDALPQDFNKSGAISEVEDKLKFLAKTSPRLGIIEAWSQVEFALGQYASRQKLVTAGEKLRANIAYHEVARQIFDADDDLFKRYNDLRELRNRAIHDHDYEPSSDNAFAFAVLATRLIDAISTRAEA